MAVYASLNSFNAGELSPKMLGRSDVSQYSKGCRTLQNFLVTPYGAAERRPGTRFIAGAKYADRKVRLIRFVFSSDVAYVCEFGHYYIRFFHNAAVLYHDEELLEIASPYSEDDLASISFVQSADVMTIAHPGYPVQELRRTAADFFTLSAKEFEYPPVLEPNLDDAHTIKPSGITGNITLTASKSTFSAGNAGGFFQLLHTRQQNEISKDFTANGTSGSLEVFGYWTFTTHGTWTGNITIQRSFDSGSTWSDFRTYSSTKDSNVSTSGEEEEENVLYRLKMEDYEASDSGTLRLCRCLLVNPDFVTTGVVRITSVTDSTHASGTVLRKLGGTAATNEWNEGAWSERRGFPRSVSYFEERMIFGGSEYRPQTIWGSKTGDWDNFLTGSRDDDGLEFTLASDTVNTVLWLCSHRNALVIGTADSEWTLTAADSSSALTPSSFQIRRQSVYGSAAIAAKMVGDTILFIQRGNRKVREFVFQWETEGYAVPDMTILADHITLSGVTETALQQLPDSILWCVLSNGTLAALTYERDQEVVGWHRHVTEGEFKSICVIPSAEEDKIYLAVSRNGAVFIEVMERRDSSFFADCGIELQSSVPLESVSGLDHLEGMTVTVSADNAAQRSKKVVNGTITLDNPAKNIIAGLPYSSVLSPMPIELETQNGHSILRNKAIGELRLRVYNSVGGKVRCGQDTFQQIITRDVLTGCMDSAIEPADEVVQLNMLSGFQKTAEIEIVQDEPLPFNITNITALYDVKE